VTSWEMVAAFTRHIGHEVPDTLTDRTPEVAGLRMRLIMEELSETHKAMLEGDIIETADGLADVKYVVVGTAVSYGIKLADFFYPPASTPLAPDAADAASLLLATLPPLRDIAYALAGRGDLATALRAFDVAMSMEAAHLGMPLRELFAEVQQSNMTKDSGRRLASGMKGGFKGPGFSKPDIAGVLRCAGAVL
jgi:predicted HAD superfamily Cof-like phosphohydrolase